MHNELNFQLQGPASEPLEISFRRDGQRLSATCTCNAGRLGKLCKHRLALLNQDPTGIVSGNPEQVNQIHELFKDTPGEAALREFLAAMAALTGAEAVFTLKKNALLAVLNTHSPSKDKINHVPQRP